MARYLERSVLCYGEEIWEKITHYTQPLTIVLMSSPDYKREYTNGQMDERCQTYFLLVSAVIKIPDIQL